MDLWSKKGLKYSIEHAQAKLAMLGGAATREEEERQVEDGDFFWESWKFFKTPYAYFNGAYYLVWYDNLWLL